MKDVSLGILKGGCFDNINFWRGLTRGNPCGQDGTHIEIISVQGQSIGTSFLSRLFQRDRIESIRINKAWLPIFRLQVEFIDLLSLGAFWVSELLFQVPGLLPLPFVFVLDSHLVPEQIVLSCLHFLCYLGPAHTVIKDSSGLILGNHTILQPQFHWTTHTWAKGIRLLLRIVVHGLEPRV